MVSDIPKVLLLLLHITIVDIKVRKLSVKEVNYSFSRNTNNIEVKRNHIAKDILKNQIMLFKKQKKKCQYLENNIGKSWIKPHTHTPASDKHIQHTHTHTTNTHTHKTHNHAHIYKSTQQVRTQPMHTNSKEIKQTYWNILILTCCSHRRSSCCHRWKRCSICNNRRCCLLILDFLPSISHLLEASYP